MAQCESEPGGEIEGDGGGILNAGILTLTDSTISGNQAAFGGGGGGVLNENGTMTITRCTISNNSASGNAHQSSLTAPQAVGYRTTRAH